MQRQTSLNCAGRYPQQAKANADFTYTSLVEKGASDSHRIVDCDVPRTCPTWQNGSDKSEELRRLLNAYAHTDPEIGYTQGMNFIAAMFLMYQSEEVAFWSFYSMMHLSSVPHRPFCIICGQFTSLCVCNSAATSVKLTDKNLGVVDQYIRTIGPSYNHSPSVC